MSQQEMAPPAGLKREETDLSLANLLHASFPQHPPSHQLAPPTLFAHPVQHMTPLPVLPMAHSHRHATPTTMMNLTANTLQGIAKRAIADGQAAAHADLTLHEPTTPTQEEMEEMEAEEQIAMATVEKVKQRYSMKLRTVEELRVRIRHARMKFDTKQKKEKEKRMVAHRNKMRMQRQISDEASVPFSISQSQSATPPPTAHS